MPNNAIVIMFDSLQRSYIGCYGNAWIQTPNMDRLAREGALFENSYTEGVPTVPCRRAMHTGRFTLQSAGWVPLSAEDSTIADLCWGRPIQTALVFDCPNYRLPKFGYTRGFDKVWYTRGHEADNYYENDPLLHLNINDFVEESCANGYTEKMGPAALKGNLAELSIFLRQRQNWRSKEDHFVAKTVDASISYLETVDREKSFFLWIDSFDPHEPWYPPSLTEGRAPMYNPDYKGKSQPYPCEGLVDGVFTEDQLHHIRMLYAESVTLCDEYLGKLMDAMARLGLKENTLLMMVSDHGEPMGNGKDGHGLMTKVRPWPYEELVHTPLLLRVPGTEPGQRIDAYVQSCDVAPTVCEWLGIPAHPDMQGKSLLPVVRKETDKVHPFAIAGYHSYSWALYNDDWSYIHWLQPDEKDSDKMAGEFYCESIDSSHIKATGGKGYMEEWTEGFTAGKKDAEESESSKVIASLDGAAQWTCSPNSVAEVPQTDELYNRRTDPHQLHNIIAEEPEVAKKLFKMLSTYMEDITNS